MNAIDISNVTDEHANRISICEKALVSFLQLSGFSPSEAMAAMLMLVVQNHARVCASDETFFNGIKALLHICRGGDVEVIGATRQ